MGLFKRKPKQQLKIDDDLAAALGLSENVLRIQLGTFAINCAISLISGLIAKCEFRTYWRHKPIKGDEYYLWNYRPNPSQNKAQFLQELIYKLCWKNEVLVFAVGGYLYIADDFEKTEYAIRETEFSNIIRKNFALTRKKYKASEVIYLKLNNVNVTNLVQGLQSSYNNLISKAVDRYIKAGGEKIILKIDSLAKGKPDYEETVKKYMTEYFKTYFEGENVVLPLHEGFSIDNITKTEAKKSDEISTISAIKKESMDAAAQAFKIPPAILRGDIADVSTLVDNMLTFCIAPTCHQISTEVTAKRYTKEEYLEGCRMSINTKNVKFVDIFSMAANIDKLRACGLFNVDDCLEELGEEPRRTKFSTQYVITKNYEAEGGENNAEEN